MFAVRIKWERTCGAIFHKGTEISVLERFPAGWKDTGLNGHCEVSRTTTATWANGSGFREVSTLKQINSVT